MNVFVLGSIGVPDTLEEILREQNPGVLFERNFAQILGMVRDGEVDRLCMYMDVWNCFGGVYNSLRAQKAAALIHEINPDLPILIWDGREYDCPSKHIPSAMQIWGKPLPITKENELYLNPDSYNEEDIPAITKKFFAGKLRKEDVPIRECISFKF